MQVWHTECALFVSLNCILNGETDMEAGMARTITLMLNQQQLALLDRTIDQGAAPDRAALIRRAIREQASKAQVKAQVAVK